MNLPGLVIVVGTGILILVIAFFQRKAAPKLRVIQAFSRLYRAIGLSVEDGTRLLVGLGNESLLSGHGAAAFSGLSMLRPLTQRTALSDRPPVATAGEGALGLLAQDALQGGFDAAGFGEYFDPAAGRVAGLTPFSNAAGTLPILADERISAAAMIGHFGPEAGLLADAADREGVFMVGASDDLVGQAVWFASASEALIGEELFVASAYVGGRPAQTASVTVQDILRWLIIASLLGGAVAKLFGFF